MADREPGHAFGLAVSTDVPIVGLASGGARGLPPCRLRASSAAAIDAAWQDVDARRLSEERGPDRQPERTIDTHPRLGYRLFARGYGTCQLAPDGASLLGAACDAGSWQWQRFLGGRCLPTAAMLRGYEVLHASTVAFAEEAVAIVGPTGAGKTSLAVRLTLNGAGFVTDDVLALGVAQERLVAHAGLGLLGLRDVEYARLSLEERDALGPPVERSGPDKQQFARAPADRPLPLGALCFLVPDAPRTSVRPIPRPDPLRLLTSTFVHETRPPERLAGLLETCARLAETVPMYELALARGEDTTSAAARLHDQVMAGGAS